MVDKEGKIKEICGVLFQNQDQFISEEKFESLIQEIPDKNEFFRILQKYLGILGLTLARIVKNEQKYFVLVSEGLHNENNIKHYSLLALLKIYFDEFGDMQPKSDIIQLLGEHKDKLDKWIEDDYFIEKNNTLSLGYNMKILFQKIPPALLKKIIFDN